MYSNKLIIFFGLKLIFACMNAQPSNEQAQCKIFNYKSGPNVFLMAGKKIYDYLFLL
jgi:hypothetical protein